MIPKCYPGDLAIVITAYNKINIGTIVKVLSLHTNQFEISAPEGDVLWTCLAQHQMTYDFNGDKRFCNRGPVPDSSLHPIRGAPRGQDIALLVVIDSLKRNQLESELFARPEAHH